MAFLREMADSEISSLWPHLEKFTPLMVRLLAYRREGQSSRKCIALTDSEVAIAAGLTLDRIRQISRMMDWSQVKVGEMRAFFTACGFDPTIGAHRGRVSDYESKCLKRNSRPFQWLHRSPVYTEEFLPLIKKLQRNDSQNQHVA